MLQTSVVLDDLRLLYVPVPKAGSTAILWALADVAGLTPADFERSTKLEVTRALTVHDFSIWGQSRRLDGRSAREVEQILSSDDWFRFTVVREPLRRLWSAWVSKLLVHDPRFVVTFGNEDWFPSPPDSSQDVVDSFRRFVRMLPTRPADWHDRHWAPQADLVAFASVRYDLVGRVERLGDALSVLTEHLRSRGRTLRQPGRENPALLPFASELFDEATLEACRCVVASDQEAFGYDRPKGSAAEPDASWHATVEANLGAIRAVSERNERIGDLRSVLRDGDEQGGLRRRLSRWTVGRS
jgi:Sulfotransferase family